MNVFGLLKLNQPIVVERESELYSLLDEFMNNNYSFAENELNDYKADNELVWHSDCYYNPDDEFSIKSVSELHIKKAEIHLIYRVKNQLINYLIKHQTII